MERLFDTPISTSNLYTPDFDRVCEILDDVCDENGYLENGSLVQRLENRLCDYHHAKYCVAFSTGFWALVAAVRIRALDGKSEVIIPSLTYRRLADVVHWAGKTPVMVDTATEGLAVCCEAIANAIRQSTSLILGVHPIVNCCDVNRLLTIGKEHGIPVVFDAVESVHETIGSQRVGSFGVGEVFSFHASKLINGAEGGYVCTNDEAFKEALVHFRAGECPGDSERLVMNGIMSDGHAALAIAGLEEISRNVAHNHAIYEIYERELQDLNGLRLVTFDENEQTSFKNIVAEVTGEFCVDRDELVIRLNAKGILARAHYFPALHARSYRYQVRRADTPVADAAMKCYINLPCGQMVSAHDVITTCRFIRSLAR